MTPEYKAKENFDFFVFVHGNFFKLELSLLFFKQ